MNIKKLKQQNKFPCGCHKSSEKTNQNESGKTNKYNVHTRFNTTKQIYKKNHKNDDEQYMFQLVYRTFVC